MPSLIPKLLSPRIKEDRLKRQDSKDDIRCSSKSIRKETKEETRGSGVQSTGKEDSKYVIRLFRRDNSREDVGRDSLNSNANSSAIAAKGKQGGKEEKQERTEEQRVGVSTTSKSKSTVHEQGKAKAREGSKESLDGKRNDEEGPCASQHERVKVEAKEQTMLDVVVNDEKKLVEEQEGVKKGDKEEILGCTEARKEGESMVEEAEVFENDKNKDSMKEISESLIENSEPDCNAFGTFERKDIGIHGRRSDDFQVVG